MELMLDVETLGTKPRCVILSVGAVLFDRYSPVELFNSTATNFYYNAQVLPQLFAGLEIDDKTAEWWSDPKREEARRIFEEVAPVPFTFINDELGEWMVRSGSSVKTIWTRGNFDLPIYEAACEAFNVKAPWFGDFRIFRDVRTALDVLGFDEKTAAVQQGPKHNALADCIYQAGLVRAAYHRKNPEYGIMSLVKPKRDDDPVPASAILDESGATAGMGVETPSTAEVMVAALAEDSAALAEDPAQAQPETVAAAVAECEAGELAAATPVDDYEDPYDAPKPKHKTKGASGFDMKLRRKF